MTRARGHRRPRRGARARSAAWSAWRARWWPGCPRWRRGATGWPRRRRALAHRAGPRLGAGWCCRWPPPGAEVLYCPANLAPLASRRTRGADPRRRRHDAARSGTRRRTCAGSARCCRGWPAARGWCSCPSRFSARRGRAGHGHRPGRRSRSCPAASTTASRRTPTPAPARAALGLERGYVLLVGTGSPRKNVGALAATARALGGRGARAGGRPGHGRHYMKTDGQAPRARAGLRARGPAARPLRRRGGAGHAVAARGLRAAVPGGHGQRHAGGGSRPRRAARDLRRCRAAGRPRRPGRGRPRPCWTRRWTRRPASGWWRPGSSARAGSAGERRPRAGPTLLGPLLEAV